MLNYKHKGEKKMRSNTRKILIYITLILIISLNVEIISHAAEKEYEYDDSGRVAKVVYEDGSYETYEYDDNGNITQINYGDANEDGSEDSNTSNENETSTEGAETSTEDSQLTTETNNSQQEVSTSTVDNNQGNTSDTTDGGTTTTGDRAPLGIIIAVMITMLIGISLIIRRNTKEER